MKISPKNIAMNSPALGADGHWKDDELSPAGSRIGKWSGLAKQSEITPVVMTFLTTLSIFAIYLVQGVVIARLLGPLGRGQFGTAIFFPRDVFLYAGLLGGIEIVNRYAVGPGVDLRSLKVSAAKVGLISGIMTACVSGLVAVGVLVFVGKSELVPFAMLCCLFVPWEHMQLTISAVDRGSKNYRAYNINRVIYAVSFLVLVAIVFGLKWNEQMNLSSLTLICILFVVSRMVGIIPTLRGMNLCGAWKKRLGRLLSNGNWNVADSSPETMVESRVPGPWALLKKGRLYALSMFASESFERLDMFLIVALATVTESGYYFVAVPAVQLLTVAPNALSVFTFNAGVDPERVIGLKRVVGGMFGMLVFQLVSALVLALILPMLILTFFKEPYAPAIPFALWLLPACAIKGYLQAIDGYLKGRGKPMIGVVARMLSIVVMVVFVVAVYSGGVEGPQQKLLAIPMAASLGQAVSMIIISVAVIRDAIERQGKDASVKNDVYVRNGDAS